MLFADLDQTLRSQPETVIEHLLDVPDDPLLNVVVDCVEGRERFAADVLGDAAAIGLHVGMDDMGQFVNQLPKKLTLIRDIAVVELDQRFLVTGHRRASSERHCDRRVEAAHPTVNRSPRGSDLPILQLHRPSQCRQHLSEQASCVLFRHQNVLGVCTSGDADSKR